MIDSQGRVIGAVFDLNILALGGAYGYDPKVNRTIAVSASAITAAVRDIYGAGRLADELAGR